ncbi:hypothetical protein QBC39DRAFT_22529 [Podospora conica]|nr:hypothetical protein QBC39DRAFT_22529 [Schizothecium conicum]
MQPLAFEQHYDASSSLGHASSDLHLAPGSRHEALWRFRVIACGLYGSMAHFCAFSPSSTSPSQWSYQGTDRRDVAHWLHFMRVALTIVSRPPPRCRTHRQRHRAWNQSWKLSRGREEDSRRRHNTYHLTIFPRFCSRCASGQTRWVGRWSIGSDPRTNTCGRHSSSVTTTASPGDHHFPCMCPGTSSNIQVSLSNVRTTGTLNALLDSALQGCSTTFPRSRPGKQNTRAPFVATDGCRQPQDGPK